MKNNTRIINQIFTRKVMCDLIEGRNNEIFDSVVRRYVNDPQSKNHGELISEIYSYLSKRQRNEYYYTNTLLNKLLDGIHNVNTTTALSQVRIGASIADFVMINGEGNLYEIKSDLDNFDRLASQLFDYYQAFSKVSVLASIHDLDNLNRLLSNLGTLGTSVGFYVLSEDDKIFSKTRSRKPRVYNDLLDHKTIFKLLRKTEYENLVSSYYGKKLEVEPVFHFDLYLEYFEKIPIMLAQKMAFQELKKRNRIAVEDFQQIKFELRSLIYFSNNRIKTEQLNQLLQKPYGGI